MFDNQYNCKRKCELSIFDITSDINYFVLYELCYNNIIDKAYKLADDNRNLFTNPNFTKSDLLFELELLPSKIIITVYYPLLSTEPNISKSNITLKAEKKFCESKVTVIKKKNTETESTLSSLDKFKVAGDLLLPFPFDTTVNTIDEYFESDPNIQDVQMTVAVALPTTGIAEEDVPDTAIGGDLFLVYLQQNVSSIPYIEKHDDEDYDTYDFYTLLPSAFPSLSDNFNSDVTNVNAIGSTDAMNASNTFSYGKIKELATLGSAYENDNLLYLAEEVFYRLLASGAPPLIQLQLNNEYFDFTKIGEDEDVVSGKIVYIYEFSAKQDTPRGLLQLSTYNTTKGKKKNKRGKQQFVGSYNQTTSSNKINCPKGKKFDPKKGRCV